jgi:hypothetical protein
MMDEYPLAQPYVLLWWNIVMDDWTLDENNYVVNDSNCNTVNLYIPLKIPRNDK